MACKRCMQCRIRMKREWVARMLLELYDHPAAWFVTLTYSPEHYPEDGSVSKVEMQKWMKRLRRAVAPKAVRYFTVGEYGGHTGRAHYHSIVFGGSEFPSVMEQLVSETWGKGFVSVSEFTPARANYIVGYVARKITKPGDARLVDPETGVCRAPEFALMSRHPGLGAGMLIRRVVQFYGGKVGQEELATQGDVLSLLRFHEDGKKRPVGRYLRKVVRELLGRDPRTPEEILSILSWSATWADHDPEKREAERALGEAGEASALARFKISEGRRTLQ